MIETMLPDGKSIGTMQAPMEWIRTHTSRFIGAVLVTIQEGRGFILIDRGKARGYYFRHENMVLKGNSAHDYFNKMQVLDFDLRKYTPQEFSRALALYGADPSAVQEETPPVLLPSEQVMAKASEPVIVKGAEPAGGSTAPVQNAVTTQVQPKGTPMTASDESDEERIREIVRQPGVEGVAIFKDGMEILSTGHVNFRKARAQIDERLRWGMKATAVLKKGSFVQITDQFEDGDIIIAPFRDVFVCIVTSSDASLGAIRGLIRGR
jgi:hypothetical protein